MIIVGSMEPKVLLHSSGSKPKGLICQLMVVFGLRMLALAHGT
jgi:hypothetical protein